MKKLNKLLLFGLIAAMIAVGIPFAENQPVSAAAPVTHAEYDFTKDFSSALGTDITTHISGTKKIGVFNTINTAAAYEGYTVNPYLTADTTNSYGFGIGTPLVTLTGAGTQNAGAHLKGSAVMIDFAHPSGENYPATSFSGTANISTAQTWREQIVSGGTSFIIGKTTEQVSNENTSDTTDTVTVTKYLYTTIGVFDEILEAYRNDGVTVDGTHGSNAFLAGFGTKGIITVDNDSAKPERSKNSGVTGASQNEFAASDFVEFVINDNGEGLTDNQKSALITYLESLSDDNVNISTIANFMDFKIEDTDDGAKITIALNSMPKYSTSLPLSATDETPVSMPEKIRFTYVVDYTYEGVTYESYLGGIGVVFGYNGNVYPKLGMGTQIIKNVALEYDTSSYVEKPTIDESKFSPVVLGAKILKGATPNDTQKLRVDIDFSNIAKAVEQNVQLVEYGIIWRAGSIENGEFSKAQLISTGAKISKAWDGSTNPSVMRIAVDRAKESYGKRICIMAYVKDSLGNYYYSSNHSSAVSNGVAEKSVMGVMKSVMKGKRNADSAGYFAAIEEYYASAHYTYGEAYTADAVKSLIDSYIDGAIDTSHSNYGIAKEFLGYVFYYYHAA